MKSFECRSTQYGHVLVVSGNCTELYVDLFKTTKKLREVVKK